MRHRGASFSDMNLPSSSAESAPEQGKAEVPEQEGFSHCGTAALEYPPQALLAFIWWVAQPFSVCESSTIIHFSTI